MARDWTLADDQKILDMITAGKTRGQIAAEFGVTRNAICGKVHRLTGGSKSEAMAPDEEPNAETIAALVEADAGGGEMFYGTVEQLIEEILSSTEENLESSPAPCPSQNIAEALPDVAEAGADTTPTSGYFTIFNGISWFATDWRWFTNPNGTLKGYGHDREGSISLYCTGANRIGNPTFDEFVDCMMSREAITEIYEKYPSPFSRKPTYPLSSKD